MKHCKYCDTTVNHGAILYRCAIPNFSVCTTVLVDSLLSYRSGDTEISSKVVLFNCIQSLFIMSNNCTDHWTIGRQQISAKSSTLIGRYLEARLDVDTGYIPILDIHCNWGFLLTYQSKDLYTVEQGRLCWLFCITLSLRHIYNYLLGSKFLS